ncbi:bifunctional malic enzyme oxidoreductase/phosphotransacetylase [Acidobacteriota bacterium]|nr:bifunctional malic enzyme oxidoreductase/phosphotransacetylase [Acidobacteriota bacterium]
MVRRQEALDYHSKGRKGKIEVIPSKPTSTSRDLSLAYSPGVAEPCLEIAQNPDDVYQYTAKGNLVGVISNGTAVLGLGNIGALASKPVMEGKGVLFKRFADIDVFDIEIDEEDPEKFVQIVKALEPTFGGINLEDLKAPECFEIEEKLRKTMNIPIMHDDQHGTAIISTAALFNALEIAQKDISKIKVVFSGAGASAIACANMMVSTGVRLENLWLCDTKGLVYVDRHDGMNPYKSNFAKKSNLRSLAQVIDGADVFVGCSAKGVLTVDMVKSMAPNPIVFALANPDPEIDYPIAKSARPDLIMATGRSDYPNQVNNVLGFPFIFRGALDVHAKEINEEMKLAAAKALAALAREEVPDSVSRAYGGQKFSFGPEYIIPKPFDTRVLLWVAPAVAKAAMDSGVARNPIHDFDRYREHLEDLQGRSKDLIRSVINRAKLDPKRIVFPEGDHPLILQACENLIEEGICKPILIGSSDLIRNKISELGLDLPGIEIIDPEHSEMKNAATELYLELRKHKGVGWEEAKRQVMRPLVFGSLLCRMSQAEGLLSGLKTTYPETIKPCLEVIGAREGLGRVAGVYITIMKDRVLFLADTTMTIQPTADQLCDTAIMTADLALNRFGIEPKVDLLSYSNFGTVNNPDIEIIRDAVKKIHEKRPDIKCDGEVQADTALSKRLLAENFPWSALQGGANILIFPNLASANISYKLIQRLAKAEIMGPITCGMARPVNVLQQDSSLNDVIHMAAITVVEAQDRGN